MLGLVPGMSVFYRPCDEDVDGRNKSGHDAGIFVMHDIKWIRDNPDAFDAALKRRGLPPEAQRLNSIEGRRLAISRVLESWRARRKVASDKIHQAMKAKDEREVQKLRAEVAECKTSIATLERE